MGSIFIMNLSTQSSSGQKKSPGLFGVIMRGALSSLLTSKSPSGMPSKSEGWIHFSITSHPPRFTALTLRLSRRCLRDCKAATPPGITKESEAASSPSLPSKYWVWWCTCNSSKPEYTILQNPETKLWQRRPFILEWILVPMSRRTKEAQNKEKEIQYSFCVPLWITLQLLPFCNSGRPPNLDLGRHKTKLLSKYFVSINLKRKSHRVLPSGSYSFNILYGR